MIRPLWRGSIEASAFLVDEPGLTTPTARARVLASWRPGTTVHAVSAGLLVKLPQPLRVRCDAAPGLPLVRIERRLVAVRLRPGDLDELGAAPDDLVLARGGRLVVEPDGAAVDPSGWLDLAEWSSPPVEPLGSPPESARLAVVAPVGVREALGAGIPATISPEAAAFLQAMTSVRGGQATTARSVVPAAVRALSRLLSWLRPAVSAMRSTAGRGGGGRSVVPAAPAGPSAWQRLRHRLEDWMARTMFWAGLAQLAGRAHTAHLRKLVDLFDQGNLAEALRHAIPLSNRSGGDARLSLFPPGPRDALQISRAGLTAGTSIGLGPDLFAMLKEMYRNAFERLKREGRIEEAAFVLAELLEQEAEAVDFLERHGRLRMAAEIAEGRELAPGLVVRQWFVAGDAARALVIARRTGAFADAVARLERTDPELARIVRVTWAGLLAEAGDLAQAVEVVWPIEAARERAHTWLDALIDAGGPVGAAMIVRKLTLKPDAWPDLRERARALLDGESTDDLPARTALIDAVSATGPNPAIRSLARLAVRAALRERDALATTRKPAFFDTLVAIAQDPVLRADLPPSPFRTSLRPVAFVDREETVALTFGADAAGPIVVRDALLLPDGRWIAALGEAGVRLLRPDGRALVHFERPADRLVPSANLARVLLLAPRGSWWRAAQLDVVRRKAWDWCEARFDAAAPSFDGAIWYVAEGEAVLGIDTLANDWRASWRVGDVGGPVKALDWVPDQLSAVVAPPDALERWRWQLPGPTLRARDPLPMGVPAAMRGPTTATIVGGDPDPTWTALVDEEPLRIVLEGPHPATFAVDPTCGAPVLSAGPGGTWVAVPHEAHGDGFVSLWWCSAGRAVAKVELRFGGGRAHAVRFCGTELVVATSRGHLVRFDLVTGTGRSVVPGS